MYILIQILCFCAHGPSKDRKGLEALPWTENNFWALKRTIIYYLPFYDMKTYVLEFFISSWV